MLAKRNNFLLKESKTSLVLDIIKYDPIYKNRRGFLYSLSKEELVKIYKSLVRKK